MARVFFNLQFSAKSLQTDVRKMINYTLGVEKFVQKEYAKIDKNKILDIVKKESLRIFKANKVRTNTKRMVSLMNNFRVTEVNAGNTKSFKIDHKFLTQNRTFTHEGRNVSGSTIFNSLDYGRKGYTIPKVGKKGNVRHGVSRFLIWKYGNKKIVYDRITRGPIFVPEKKGLFFLEKSKMKVEEFIEALREKVKKKMKGM